MMLVKPNHTIFCAFQVLEAKNIRFYSNFSDENMGKKWGLSVAERAKIVTVEEEGYLGTQIAKKQKVSETVIHQTTVKFRNFGVFRTCTGLEIPGLPPKGMVT